MGGVVAGKNKKDVLPEVREFRQELSAAVSLDAAVELKQSISRVKEAERQLRLVASANRDLHLGRFFEVDRDAARFYGLDWQALSTEAGNQPGRPRCWRKPWMRS